MKKQILSFKAALCGLWYTITHEVHMRFHLVAGFYVILFGFFYELSAVQWTVLLLLIGAILSAEVTNTSIERLANRVTTERDPLIKAAKDTAAAAVLVLAIFAVAVAFIIFFDIEKIVYVFGWFVARPLLFALLILSAALSVVFVLKCKRDD